MVQDQIWNQSKIDRIQIYLCVPLCQLVNIRDFFFAFCFFLLPFLLPFEVKCFMRLQHIWFGWGFFFHLLFIRSISSKMLYFRMNGTYACAIATKWTVNNGHMNTITRLRYRNGQTLTTIRFTSIRKFLNNNCDKLSASIHFVRCTLFLCSLSLLRLQTLARLLFSIEQWCWWWQ